MDTVHNPDRYMAYLRQLLSQGKKRIGLLVGAGAPTSILVNKDGQIVEDGDSLIPNVEGLTTSTLGALDPKERRTIDAVVSDLGDSPNIEAILSRVRQLAEAIGPSSVHGLDGSGFKGLAERLCEESVRESKSHCQRVRIHTSISSLGSQVHDGTIPSRSSHPITTC